MASEDFLVNMSKEELADWLSHSTTRKVFKVLSQLREECRELVLNGNTLDMSSTEHTALKTATLLGNISGLNKILEIKMEVDNE